jgi:hypothetical protein
MIHKSFESSISVCFHLFCSTPTFTTSNEDNGEINIPKIESLCLGNAENFLIWRAVLTYGQTKRSSCYVIRGYVWLLSFKFFEFNHFDGICKIFQQKF